MYKSGTVLGKVNNTENKTNSGTYKSGMVLGKVSESALRTEQSSVKIPHYKESSQNQAKQQSATDFLFSQLPTGNVRQDVKKHQELIKSKTTIPSVNYDEGLATELKLKKEMDEAKSRYEDVKNSDDRNLIIKGLDYLGGIDNVSYLKGEYQNAKDKYNDYKSQRTENIINQKYGISGEEYIARLKDLKDNAKTDAEKDKYKIQLQQTKKDLYGDSSVWDFIKDNVKSGFLNLNKQVNDSTNLIFGKMATALGFKDNIFSKFKSEADIMQQNASVEAYKTNKYLGAEFLGNAVQATTAALPDAVFTTLLAFVTGGGNVGAKLLGDAAIKSANPTITYNLGNAVKETVKSPVFYTSFINELGGKYEEAKADGASEEQAIFNALLTSAINARLEMGGYQALPDKLVATKGNAKKLWQYFTSTLGEGTEELSQRIASDLVDVISYDKNKEYFSKTNPDAIVHPESMFEEFVMGTIVGGVLGGGQLTINGIVNASTQSQYKTIGKAVISTNNIQEIIDYCKSARNEDIQYIARNVTEKNIADEDAGRLYQYTVRNINEKFEDVYTEADFDNVISEYFSGDISESIRNIASSAFANKLVEMNIEPEKNDTYRKFTTKSSFAKQVDDVLNGKHNPRYDLYVSETPKVFTDIGFSNSALLMRNSKVKEILEKHSEMSVDTIKNIPQAIQNPILVLKSKTNPKQSVVAITDIETEKGNMIVPIWINQEGNYIDIDLGTDVVTETNFVASAYGRNVKTLIEFANENDGFLYQNEDTEKVRQLLARNGLQLPTPLKLSDSDINVPQNDTDVNNNISTGAENNSNLPENTLDSMLDESKDDEGRPTFREPEKKDIFRAPTAEEQMNTIIGKHENVEQRHLKDVAKKLGVNLRWDNDCSRGYYDPATNTIAINPFWSVTKCYYTLFKHEFVHYLEAKSGYDSFKKYLTNHSKAFYEYVRGKLEQKGIEFTGGREGALAAYTDIVLKERQAAEEIPYRIRKGYNTEKIHREIIADFVGDVLLGGESVTKAEQALLEIAETNRSLFQKIQDWLRDVISFLKGESKNRTLVEDLEYLNNRLARVWDSAQKKNANKGEAKYSYAGVNSITHNHSLLEKAIKLEDVGKMTSEEIRQETGWFRGYDSKWRYEISDRDMEIDTRGKFHSNPDIRRYTELVDKVYFDSTATDAEIKELSALEKNLDGVSVEPKTLGELIKHDGLFGAYPQLKDMKIHFANINERGAYDPIFKEIVLNKNLKLDKTKLSKTLIHEIQHAIQDVEGFAGGSNPEYWQYTGISEEKIREYYEKTAGEIEARDAANRWWRSDEARKEIRPDIDRQDVVFAESGTISCEILTSDSGEKYVNIKPDAIDLNNGSSIAKNIASILSEKFNNLILVNGQYFRVNAKTNSEFTGSDWALALKKEHPDWFNDKIQTLAYADDILKSAKGWINRVPKHPRRDKITSFGHGEILYKVGNNGYSAEVIVGLKDDGSAVLYDIIKISDKKIVDTNSVGKGNSLSSTDASTEYNIPNDVEKVNNNSIQESENNSFDNQWSVLSPEFTAEMTRLTEAVKNGEISVDEFVNRVNDLTKNEQKVSDELRAALAEQEELHIDYMIDSARHLNQYKKRIKRQNEQLAKRSSEISAEITAQREERASKQKNIKHIRKVVSCIDKMFRTNSEKKHIPEKLKEASAYFIKIFVDNDASPFDKKEIRNIRTLYNDLYTKGDKGFKIGGIDTETLEYLEQLEEKLEGKTLRQLNNAEILLIKDITDNFYHIIQDENEMFFEGKKRKVEEIGTQAIKELKSEKSKRENGIINATDKYIKYSNMTPIYFFDRIGGVFKSLFYDVVYAQDKWYRNVENAKTYIRQQKEKYNYDKWDNDTFKFTTEKGDEIEITREQAMLLYATARREYLKKGTPTEHLFRGGVVIPPSQITLKVILKKCKESDAKGIAKITDAMVREIDSKAHRIMPQDIVRVMEWLTKEQIGYANAMVKYLSNDMAALGNEISMQLYGITKFNEEYYIPYNSAQNFLYSQPGVSNEARIKHQSFTKDTVHGANNPLVLSDFSEVCADHINRMCMYNAFTIPLENMTKIFNYQRKGENVDTVDIKAEIERVHGKAATDYIEHFLTDMNGNVRTSGTDKLIGWLISKFKKGAVFASASVVVQQPSAVMRAMTYINPKYFISTTLKLSERDYQQAVEYAPVAGIKEMGRFDTGVGAATTNWLLQETPKGFKNKVKAFVDIKDSTYRDDKLSWFAAKADEMTWAHIWAAVKAEVADTTTLKAGTEEFFKACGERFTEVINYTQVYDSTLSRSQIMRDKSRIAQMLTAFMSEPTVSLNVLMDAVHQAKTNGEVGKKFAKRAVGAFVGNVVLNSLLKSLITAGRDDDEDKTYLEKYIGESAKNFLSDINPLAMIPFVKDVISVFKGYPVERADMNLFSDLAQSISYLQSDNKTTTEKIESIAGSLAAFLGLPVKNVLRDIRTAYNMACDFKKDIISDTADTDLTGIKYAITDSSNADIYKELTEAAEKDDEEEYQRIYKHLVDNGKSDSDIRSGIKGVYRNSKEVKKETEKYIDKLENNKTYKKLDDKDKKSLKNKISSSLATKEMINAIDDNVKKYDELYATLRRNKKAYERMRKEMLAEGYTAKQITDGVEIARIAYMKSIGIDVHEYLLYKIATSKKNADMDNSGGVNKHEKIKAIQKLDLDSKAKQYFINNHK